jgi:hypothetical protein
MKRALVFIEEPTLVDGRRYKWRVRRLPWWHWRSIRLTLRDALWRIALWWRKE